MIKFKKIASLLTSALMVGSTIGLAAAANYPAPFVTGGSPNVGIVYGSSPTMAITDLVAATNIMDNLNGFVVGGVTGTTPGTVTGGDFVLIAKSSDKLNLGNTWSVFTGSIDDDDLTTLLADGTYSADDNDEFDYDQKIIIGAPNMTHFRDSDYEDLIGASDETPAIGFQISSSTFIMNYTIDFKTNVESDIVSGDADDFEGSDLTLLGKTYFVSDAKLNGPVGFWGKMTLLDSATRGTVREGETTTVPLGDTSYDASISFIDNDEVVLMVNGVRAPSSGKLKKGESFRLDDNAYLGIIDISRLEVSGELGQVTFSLGSGKLEITSDAEVKLNDKDIDGVKGYVYNASGGSSSIAKLDKIEIEWIADDEKFLTSETDLTLPGFGAVKLSMNDFIRTSEEEKITIDQDSDSIELKIPIRDGMASINLLYANASGEFIGLGKDANKHLLTIEPNVSNNSMMRYYEKLNGADYHTYFVASYNITGEAESALVRAKIEQDSGVNKTTLKKWDGTDFVTVCEKKANGENCDITTLISVTVNDANMSDDKGNKSVLIAGGSNVNFNTVYSKGGLRFYLPYVTINDTNANKAGEINGSLTGAPAGLDPLGSVPDLNDAINWSTAPFDTWVLSAWEEDKDDNIGAGRFFNLTVNDNSDGDLHITLIDGSSNGGPKGLEVGDGTRIYEGYLATDVATRFLHNVPSSGTNKLEVYYPSGDSESYAEVFLTEVGAEITGGGVVGGGGTTVGVPITDREVSSVSGKNLIVVGGSCVNTEAASLLGSSTPLCGADFTAATTVGAGQYLIETFARSGGAVATLVAGYNAGDTTNAGTFIRTQTVDTTVGTAYIGSSGNSATLRVSTP